MDYSLNDEQHLNLGGTIINGLQSGPHLHKGICHTLNVSPRTETNVAKEETSLRKLKTVLVHSMGTFQPKV